MKLWIAALAVLLISSPAVFASSRRVQRVHGAVVFTASGCAHCHAIRNVGGHSGPDLSGVGRRLKKDQMRRQILDGSKHMPPFRDDLQDAEVADLISYLRSCREKKK